MNSRSSTSFDSWIGDEHVGSEVAIVEAVQGAVLTM